MSFPTFVLSRATILNPLAIGLLALTVAPIASAATSSGATPYPTCEKTPSDGDVAGAKGAFQAGQQSYNESDYALAITYWEDAYRRDCTAHQLLANLSRAYELNGQLDQAVLTLETFLERSPDSDKKAEYQRRIEKLNERIADRDAKAAMAMTTAEEPLQAEDTPKDQNTEASQADSAEAAQSADDGPQLLGPIILSSVGVAGMITGGILAGVGKSQYDSADAACNGNCSSEQAEDGNNGRALNQTGWVIFGVSSAALLGGLVWGWIEMNQGSDNSKSSKLIPIITPQYGGLSFSGQF